jgi:hypothetical protein
LEQSMHVVLGPIPSIKTNKKTRKERRLSNFLTKTFKVSTHTE